MELTILKDINPHDFHIGTYNGKYVLVRDSDFEIITMDELRAFLSMARSHYDFVNKQGSFANPDDLTGVL